MTEKDQFLKALEDELARRKTESKNKQFKGLTERERANIRLDTQSFSNLPITGEYPGSNTAKSDSVLAGLKRKPDKPDEVISLTERLKKARGEELTSLKGGGYWDLKSEGGKFWAKQQGEGGEFIEVPQERYREMERENQIKKEDRSEARSTTESIRNEGIFKQYGGKDAMKAKIVEAMKQARALGYQDYEIKLQLEKELANIGLTLEDLK